MVAFRRLSLAHMMDDGNPPPPPTALFDALAKEWASGVVDDEDFAAGCYLCTSVNLEVGSLAETGRIPFKLLRSLAGRCLEGLDLLALLTIDRNGWVAVLRLLFCVAASGY